MRNDSAEGVWVALDRLIMNGRSRLDRWGGFGWVRLAGDTSADMWARGAVSPGCQPRGKEGGGRGLHVGLGEERERSAGMTDPWGRNERGGKQLEGTAAQR